MGFSNRFPQRLHVTYSISALSVAGAAGVALGGTGGVGSVAPLRPSLKPFKPSPNPLPSSGSFLPPNNTSTRSSIRIQCVGSLRKPIVSSSARRALAAGALSVIIVAQSRMPAQGTRSMNREQWIVAGLLTDHCSLTTVSSPAPACPAARSPSNRRRAGLPRRPRSAGGRPSSGERALRRALR